MWLINIQSLSLNNKEIQYEFRLEKNTSAVQETSSSRHNGVLIKGPPQFFFLYNIDMMIRNISGGPSISPP